LITYHIINDSDNILDYMAYDLLYSSLRQIFSVIAEVPVGQVLTSNIVTFLMAMTKDNFEYLYPLRDYIQRYPNVVNEKDKNGHTPIIFATCNFKRLHPDVPQIVLNGCTTINETFQGMTALGYCVSDTYKCDYATFKAVLGAGADPNMKFGSNMPLQYAASSGRPFKRQMIIDLVKLGGHLDNDTHINSEECDFIQALMKPIELSSCGKCAFCMDKEAVIMNAHPDCPHVLGCKDCYMKLRQCHLCGIEFVKGKFIGDFQSKNSCIV
jgi:hypothetical protein